MLGPAARSDLRRKTARSRATIGTVWSTICSSGRSRGQRTSETPGETLHAGPSAAKLGVILDGLGCLLEGLGIFPAGLGSFPDRLEDDSVEAIDQCPGDQVKCPPGKDSPICLHPGHAAREEIAVEGETRRRGCRSAACRSRSWPATRRRSAAGPARPAPPRIPWAQSCSERVYRADAAVRAVRRPLDDARVPHRAARRPRGPRPPRPAFDRPALSQSRASRCSSRDANFSAAAPRVAPRSP